MEKLLRSENPMISPELIATLDKLTPTLQAEVLNYAEYLAACKTSPPAAAQAPTQTYRKAGSLKGMFTMAPDFDAPLEDLKDYM
jgi:Protein of unknown function (DUF2281)